MPLEMKKMSSLNEFKYGKVVEVREEYYRWLINQVKRPNETVNTWILLRKMHEKIFTWYILNDENRAEDGKNLRRIFCDNENYNILMFDDMKITVLEVLIGISSRMASMMMDLNRQNIEGTIPFWFWHLVKNLTLDKYLDPNYCDSSLFLHKIDVILDRWMNRTYQNDGTYGNIFPMPGTKKNQKDTEIWYQMSQYLVEEYYLK